MMVTTGLNPLHHKVFSGTVIMLLAGFLMVGMLASRLPAQTSPAAPAAKPASASQPPAAAKPTNVSAANRSLPSVPRRERSYYGIFWGVDSLKAKAVESGELIQFSYRVLDPEKAKPLNEKTNEPAMYDPAIGAKLIVPSLEKVGQLRQSATPEEGKFYWMAFSNPGAVVKKGDRVNVVIGSFHIEGLVVE